MAEPNDRDEVWELSTARLPWQQAGPFLILGLDKDASSEQVESATRQRLDWIRQGILSCSEEDLNWARDMLLDAEQRIVADAQSLNLDTLDRQWQQLRDTHDSTDWEHPHWPIWDYPLPEIPVPSPEQGDANGAKTCDPPLPEIPDEIPALSQLIDDWRSRRIDPWNPTDCRTR